MKHLFAKTTLALALGATALAATPADAQRYRGGYRGHDRAGTALVAGVAGLAIGAALASDRRPYYNDGYYDGPEVVYEDYPQPYYYGYPYRGYGYHYYGGYRGYRGGYGGYRGGGYHGGGYHGGGHHR